MKRNARFPALLCLVAGCAAAADKTNALAQFSDSLERLAAAVAPSVVQVQVSAWCASASDEDETAAVMSPCRVVGSGVIVDPSGYIVTNEHVVRNARAIRVLLTPKSDDSRDGLGPIGKQQMLDTVVMGANREPVGKRQLLDAVVVGASRDTDIALLKIEASGLPAISLHQKHNGPRQGQLVLAVGSPEGLDNTMTTGIVSAVGRQPHPDYPMLYIQTDAAINPGNSGGPLLDVDGGLIGINTFMVSESGRNQGLGFAVPAAVVRYVYEELRNHGAVRYSLVGVQVQTVTPGIAQGLGLRQGYGVMISDVMPGSPADASGLRPRDIITAVDGASISALPYYAALMYLHDATVPVAVDVLRGQETLRFKVPAVTAGDRDYRDTWIDAHESLVPELGIFGRPVNSTLAVRNGLRSKSGIYVFATTAGNKDSGFAPAPGDVIASFNGTPIRNVQELRRDIEELAGMRPAVLQVERNGQFVYIEWEPEKQSLAPDRARARRDGSKSEPGRGRR